MTAAPAREIIVKGEPAWLPDPLKGRKVTDIVTYKYSKHERNIYRKRPLIPVSDWAERHRYVMVGPFKGTRFRKTTFPYAAGIMDASFYKSVQEIVLCCADQTGKSFIIDTCIGYAADHAPGPVLYCYPDESTTLKNMKLRLLPMFRSSSRLRSYLTGYADDESQKMLNLQHMTIHAAWASSVTKTANDSIRYGAADEVDKYAATVNKKEGAPLDKINNRLRLYRFNKKFFKSSTPTIETGPIWVAINACIVVFEYRVKCPECGHMHLMDFETENKWFRWDGEKDALKIENEDLAYYICPGCGSIWKDDERDEAVRLGGWYAMAKTPDGKREIKGAGLELFECLEKHNPRSIGFQIPAWISPVVGLSETCSIFVAAQKDRTKLKQWNNSYVAKPWTDFTQDRQEDVILKLRDDRPRGVVPGGGVVQCLTCGIDVQGRENADWFVYEIRAWGWPDESMKLESWQIREGYLESYSAIEEVVFNTKYYDVDKNAYMVALTLMDAGYKTNDVYNFCIRHRRKIRPTKGFDGNVNSDEIRFKNKEFYAGRKGKKTAIPGGVLLYSFSNKYFKDILADKLEIHPADPNAWHLHSETTTDWARQLCSETIDPKTLRWVQIGSMANHGWDCSVLNLVAAEMLRLKYKPRPGTEGRQKGRRVRSRGI